MNKEQLLEKIWELRIDLEYYENELIILEEEE